MVSVIPALLLTWLSGLQQPAEFGFNPNLVVNTGFKVYLCD